MKNRLILPSFKKRESTKSHSFSKKENKKLKKKKNYSENNIIQKIPDKGKFSANLKGINNNINSKWITCTSSYTNYINNFEKIVKQIQIIIIYSNSEVELIIYIIKNVLQQI